MQTLATTFRAILAGLQAAIAPHTIQGRPRTPFLVFIWTRIGRTATRFENLFARWRNGTLPKPRAPRPATPNAAAPRPGTFRLPRSRAWLLREMQDHHVNGRAGALEYFLNDPQLPEFLAAAPQAKRLRRPLCHMLGIQMPGDPRWPDPKPAKPAKTPLLPLPPVPESAAVKVERADRAYYHPIFSKAR